MRKTGDNPVNFSLHRRSGSRLRLVRLLSFYRRIAEVFTAHPENCIYNPLIN
jgi:hypothetical protein